MAEFIDYDVKATPVSTDNAVGIDTPGGSWSLKRFTLLAVLKLLETASLGVTVHPTNLPILHKTDATTAPGDDDDTSEGYAPGSVWIDLTGQEFYICVDATEGAAVWSQGGGGGGSEYSISLDNTSVVITDTGTNGLITLTVDGDEVATFSATEASVGPLAINFDLESGDDDTYSASEMITGADGGETISQWQLVYYDATAGEFMLADADASGEAPAWGIAVAGTTDGNPIYIMTRGFGRNDTWAWTAGQKIYLADTPGGLTATAPSTSGDIVQPVGIAVTDDLVYFNIDPVNGWYTVT